MRGRFEAACRAEGTLSDTLRALALKDGFHPDEAAFAADLAFAPPDGAAGEITVQTELGENLLVWARQLGLIEVKKIG